MLKTLLFASCVAVSLGIVSCRHDDAPQPAEPAPVREATINTVFRYYSPDESRGINHLADKPFGQWSSDRLTVKFHNLIPGLNPTDEIQFILPKSRQKPNVAGTYTLASQPDPGQGDVQVNYLRPGTSSWNNGVNSNAHVLEGSFSITSYDARRNLISGSYAVEAQECQGRLRVPGQRLQRRPPPHRRLARVRHIYGSAAALNSRLHSVAKTPRPVTARGVFVSRTVGACSVPTPLVYKPIRHP